MAELEAILAGLDRSAPFIDAAFQNECVSPQTKSQIYASSEHARKQAYTFSICIINARTHIHMHAYIHTYTHAFTRIVFIFIDALTFTEYRTHFVACSNR